MCNAYTVRPKASAKDIAKAISDEIQRLPSRLVRRTGKGVVLTRKDGDLAASTMRWGFFRPFSNAINNARSDNFKSPVWEESYRLRRCLVPVSSFYEWKALPHGGKQAYEFEREDREWMWIAGLFEDSEKFGPCYATITTEPSALVEPIHDRMLAVIAFEDGLDFLHGSEPVFVPYQGPLITRPCESPLAKPKAGDSQQELF